jgi:predicted metalloprotease with PDZ domain
MWSYKLSVPKPNSRFLHIDFECEIADNETIKLALPKWRPGRYELGNFAKNIGAFAAYDQNGVVLKSQKVDSHTWEIHTKSVQSLKVSYTYYAAQPDAGACWVDEDLTYVNPIHCCVHIVDELSTACKMELLGMSDKTLASSLPHKNHIMQARDFHELVDSPFFVSSNLQHRNYECEGINFHVWLQGECNPDWDKILKDFKNFTNVQLKMMNVFPVKEYHFFVLLLPFKFYHGVEHVANTVLALGPGNQLMNDDLYNDFLGVASHELFHSWNVKTLRPADFHTYQYNKENYSRLGWVYEGITTYYGDLFLARSGFFNVESYLKEVNARLQKHLDNYGRFNSSVAESSFDTWLDGYVPGIPNRKTSIYEEGSLIALILDLSLRKATNNTYSLDNLYAQLYKDFTKEEIGYREIDFKNLAIEKGGEGMRFVFDELINKPASYESCLHELLDYIGCYISKKKSKSLMESYYGCKLIAEVNAFKISQVMPNSPAAENGLAKDDELIAVNGWKIEGNLNDLLKNANGDAILTVFSMRRIKQIKISKTDQTFFDTVSVQAIDNPNEQQKNNFKLWCGLEIGI